MAKPRIPRHGDGGASKSKSTIPHGFAFVTASFNNTMVSITDPEGNVVSWSSAGKAGLKGSRRNSPFAAELAGRQAALEAKEKVGMHSVDVIVKGPGVGGESALRALNKVGLRVNSVESSIVSGELRMLSQLGPMQQVSVAQAGVSSGIPQLVAQEMGIPKTRLYRTIGLAPATVSRNKRQEKALNQDDSERVLGILSLIGQVERIVKESGEPEGFDAGKWVAAWLERPQPALDGRRPAELMDSATGRQIVTDLVARIQSGAYS